MLEELWREDTCADYLDSLRRATTADLERYLNAVEASKNVSSAVAMHDSPIDAALTSMRERCTCVEAQCRSVLEKMETVERRLTEASIDSFKLKQKMKFHMESHATKSTAARASGESDLLADVLAGIPPNASAEQQVEILKNALAALSVENQVMRAAQSGESAGSATSPRNLLQPSVSPRPSMPGQLSPRSAAAAAVAAVGSRGGAEASGQMMERISLEGYLLKRGGKTDRKWQRRYCILELLPQANMYVINYRVKEKDQTDKGHIPLPWATVMETKDARADNCFMICPSITQSKTKNYYLAAQTPQEMREWIFAIEMASRVTPTAESVLKLGYVKLDTKRVQTQKRGSRIGAARNSRDSKD